MIDPGVHEIVATAPGFHSHGQMVRLRKGERLRVVIPRLTEMPPPVQRWHMLWPIGISVSAVGVATTVAGLAFNAQASSSMSNARSLCGEHLVCTTENHDRGKQLLHDANVSASRATGLLITGVSALAAGAVVLLAAAHDSKRPATELLP